MKIIKIMKIQPKKFFFMLLASLAALSSTALAADAPNRDQILSELAGRIDAAEDIQAAIRSGVPYGDVQKMIDALKPVDLTSLGLPPQEGDSAGASMAGSMYSSDTSVQDQFAKLQQELAEASKNQASLGMSEVTRLQGEANQAGSFLKQAEQLQKSASDSNRGIPMPEAMKYYLDTNKLPYPKGKQGYSAGEWQAIIQSLNDFIGNLGTRIQAAMVNVQNSLGNYNSYSQDVSASLQGQHKPLSGLAKGQSLFSQQEGTLNTAPVATSMIIGVLIGMLAMWGILKKKDKKMLAERQS